jgi:hypothetical protein
MKKFVVAALVAVSCSVVFAGGEISRPTKVYYSTPAPIPTPYYQAQSYTPQPGIFGRVTRFSIDRFNDFVTDPIYGTVDAVSGLFTLDPACDDGRGFFQSSN